MSKDLWGLVIDLEIHWGLSLTHFLFTKSRPALRIIPPTTMIGALAYPLARLAGWPENNSSAISSADRLRMALKGVYYRVVKGALVPHAEVTKVVWYKVREKRVVSDAAALQKIYAQPGTVLRVYYVFSIPLTVQLLGEEWEKMLVQAAWSITRLGAKESLVSVIGVVASSVDVIKVSETRTRATIPLDHVKSIKGDYVVSTVIDWRLANIGRYHGAPMTRVAQPLGPLSQPPAEAPIVRLREPIAYVVVGEPLIPWMESKNGEV